jgi:hypothetical protein
MPTMSEVGDWQASAKVARNALVALVFDCALADL